MKDSENPVWLVFAEAIEIADATGREEYLDQACGSDWKLREEVAELLRAEKEAGRFLRGQPNECPIASADNGHGNASTLESADGPGSWIGRYKLLQKIGEGGCGIVYLAEQEEPVHRKVALKIIKLGMDTRSVVARFEAERQALALMDHPNIAKVYDGGATETGRPYFVMELVQGSKITEYCDRHRFSTRQRLELFRLVCQAVQHAHQKGIIHRDLKPSNILVAEHDGVAEVKVIDFGIAKAAGDLQLTDKTIYTAFEQFIGTPAYMSPEQARLGEVDIDTRSDIYSLGVLLYELLTGHTPLDTRALKAAGLDEARRSIQEKEPPRPSSKLTTLSRAELQAAGDARGVEGPRLIHLLRGDLDWIIMKCLEKERSRRYETANGVARDVQRYLENEPVLARPPSRVYEFQKTVRRHKLGFLATSCVLIALSLGLVASTFEIMRARRAEAALEGLERQAVQAAEKAQADAAQAEEKLRGYYFAEAQAFRFSRRAGLRAAALKRLGAAARIRPSLELRNEAIVNLVSPDLETVSELRLSPAEQDGVVFDPDYQRYACTTQDGEVIVRRVDDSVELMRFTGYNNPLCASQFSPDGRFLLLGYRKNTHRVELLDLEGKAVRLQVDQKLFRTSAFSSDSRLLAIAFEQPELGNPVRVFDVASGQELGSFKHGTLPFFIQFNPKDSNHLLTSDYSRVVSIWDWPDQIALQTVQHPDWVIGIDWHPNGEVLATGCGDNRIRTWSAATGEKQAELTGHEWAPVQVRFTPDGSFLVSRGWEGMIRLWDVAAQRELVNKKAYGYSHHFSPSGARIAVNSDPGKAEILKAVTENGLRNLRADQSSKRRLQFCDFSQDDRLIVASDQTAVGFWDPLTGRQVGRCTNGLENPFPAFQPGGTNLIVRTDRGIEQWDVNWDRNGKILQVSATNRVLASDLWPRLSFSGDGRTLGVASGRTLRLFKTGAFEEAGRITTPWGEVLAALSPNAALAATWSRTSTNVLVWDVARSNIVQALPTFASTFASFSPWGDYLIVGNQVEFYLWDTRTWQRVWSLRRDAAGHYGYASFSPDSSIVAVAFTRFMVRLMATATGRELATLESPDSLDIEWITFDHSGTRLAVVNGSGSIQLWDLRAVRQQLDSLGLDWEMPPYPGIGR